MMGTKERTFSILVCVSLEDFIPVDHFYRHLDSSLDLSSVRDLVHDSQPRLVVPVLTRLCSSSLPWSCSSRTAGQSAS